VRVIRPAIGGAFGGKLEATIEPVAAQLAILTGQPVKIELNRREVIASTRTRHGAVVYMKTGVRKDGTITAQDFRVLTNTGAYAGSAINVVAAMSHKVFKLYKTRNIRYTGIPVYTNTPVAGAMRGYGSPQAFYAQQVQLQKIAGTLGIDMIDCQRKNLVEPDARDPLYNKPMGNPRPLDCIVKGAKRFDWVKRVAAQQKSAGNGRIRRGVGMAMGLHGNGLFGAHRDFTCLTLKLNEDGTALLSSGSHDMGNGSITVQTQVIGEILGIDPDSITVNETDTETVPYNLGDYASRGTWVGGNAAKTAALAVKQQVLEEAAHLLSMPAEELSIAEGMIFSTANPEKRTSLKEAVLYAHRESQREIIASETYASTAGPTSYGAHFAEVEVDTQTGEVKVVDYLAIHDVGKAINPLSLEGQIEGAIQMGIGYALSEGLVLNDAGKVINNSLKKYKMLRAPDMPHTTVLFVEEGEEPGPFGGKSIGECSTVASAPAVVNAVSNALGGIPFYDFPLRPDCILNEQNG
jgi:CO/xanthine dehydrogenase Mo-binding subunit